MGKKKKNSSKFRVSTGQNFFRWARFARQTVHRGNTTRISLLGKHVGRNTSPKYAHRNRDMSTDERGVFQNMSPSISALAIDPIVAAGRGTETGCVSCLGSEILFPRDLSPPFLPSMSKTNTTGCEIVVFLSNSISVIRSNSRRCLYFRFSMFNHQVNWSGGKGVRSILLALLDLPIRILCSFFFFTMIRSSCCRPVFRCGFLIPFDVPISDFRSCFVDGFENIFHPFHRVKSKD